MGFTDVFASGVVMSQPGRRCIWGGAPPLCLPRSLILTAKDSESFILVGTSTLVPENGRFVPRRSFGGRRGVSSLVV